MASIVELPILGPVAPPTLHVMTDNLRYHDPGVPPGHPDHWPTRRAVQQRMLRAERPSLIGFQEVLVDQLADLRRMLGEDYVLVGEGRLGGAEGEHNPIAVDTGRLELLGHEQFWLSATPEVVGSSSWGSSLPRIAVVARLRDRATGRELTMVNTHLDHVSEEARGGGAGAIRERLAPVSGPVVVTGDMNSPRGAGEAWAAFTGPGAGQPFVEVWDVAAERRSADVETFHGYAPGSHGEGRIDWILVRDVPSVSAVATNTFTHDGAWPSDHHPVQAVVDLG